VIPELHGFCNNDLSAFYFDIRKDALYCDAPDSARRRAARTVLDHLHRCLTTWLAPVLCFTAEEAWLARFPGEDASVHLQLFPTIPAAWRDDQLAERWTRIRAIRGVVTTALEAARRDGMIGASLQAAPHLALPPAEAALLDGPAWAEICITSGFALDTAEAPAVEVRPAPGQKCDRCWRVLEEVGQSAAHPTLCLRCEAVVS
jgi:isoleucyl-tRNA synthetase